MKEFIRTYRKYAIAIIVLVGTFLIYYFFFTGDISGVSLVIDENVDYSIHSKQDIEEGFEVVKRQFKFFHGGNELVKLEYSQEWQNSENPYEMVIECDFICHKKGFYGNTIGDGAQNNTNYYLKCVNGKWRFDEIGFR